MLLQSCSAYSLSLEHRTRFLSTYGHIGPMHNIENRCSSLYICLSLLKYTKCSAVFFFFTTLLFIYHSKSRMIQKKRRLSSDALSLLYLQSAIRFMRIPAPALRAVNTHHGSKTCRRLFSLSFRYRISQFLSIFVLDCIRIT